MPAHASKASRRHATQQRSQQTVSAILEGAAQVLRSNGYAGTTTNRIAERAGVSVGSVYQYFDDKDAVFEALIVRETQALAGGVTHYQPNPARPLDQVLREILTLAITVAPHAPELFRQLGQVPNAALSTAVDAARGRIIAFMRDILEGYRGQLRVADLDLAAFMIVASAEGAGMTAGPELYNERLVEQFVTMFSRYLMDPVGPSVRP